MLTIHGVPLSVHTRKTIVTAILKGIDYRFEVVIPVIPDNPPPNWSTLSPTGLIPVLQDGDFTLAEFDGDLPVPGEEAAVAAGAAGRCRRTTAARSGSTPMPAARCSAMSCIRCFIQKIVAPNIRKEPTDQAVVDDVLNNVQPKIFGYLESQIGGKVPGRRHADARRHRHRVELHHLSVSRLSRSTRRKYPKLADVSARDHRRSTPFQRALARRKAVRRADGAGPVVSVVSVGRRKVDDAASPSHATVANPLSQSRMPSAFSARDSTEDADWPARRAEDSLTRRRFLARSASRTCARRPRQHRVALSQLRSLAAGADARPAIRRRRRPTAASSGRARIARRAC